MKLRTVIALLVISHYSQAVLSLDFNKSSSEKTGSQSNNALLEQITKEKFFDMICEKAGLIQQIESVDGLKRTPTADDMKGGSGYVYVPDAARAAREKKEIEELKAKYGVKTPNKPQQNDTSAVSAAKIKAYKSLSNSLTVTAGKLCMMDNVVSKLEDPSCVNPQPPLLVGVTGLLNASFFNSYGKNLKNEKECQDAPYRIADGYAAIVNYYAERSPANENNVLKMVESARKMPKACGEKVVDYLTYADKRLEKCMSH